MSESSVSEAVPQPVEQAAPAEVVKPAEAQQPDLSAQFLELQRRDKEVRAAKNKIKQEIEAQKAKLLDEIKANPMGKLQELGIAPDVLATQFLNAPGAPSLEDKVSKLERELEAERAAKKAAADAEALAAYDKSMFAVVEKDQDSFELVNNHKDGKRLYKEAVYAYWREFGEAPNLEVIAKHVEAELEADAKKLLGLKKLSPKAKAEAVAEAAKDIAVDAKKEAPPTAKGKTLNSGLTASATPKVKYVGVNKPSPSSANSSFQNFQAERQAKFAEAYARMQATKSKG